MYKISISPEEIDALDLGCFTGEIQVIDKDGEAFSKAIAYLRRQKIIGFDTESRPSFGPSQPRYGVSLLQLSGPEKAYLFRIKSLGMHKKLCSILSNEKIIKVGAAVNDDVRGLEKYNNFEAKSFVDLQKIGWQYGIRDKSVKKMSAIILGIRISKTQQLSNWEADRLSEAQQRYAATDAWVCREMYLKLLKSEKHPLTPEEQMPPAQLQQMLLKKQMAAEKAKAEVAGKSTEQPAHPKSKKSEQQAKRKRLYNKRRRERKRKQNKERKLAQQNNNGKGNTEER